MSSAKSQKSIHPRDLTFILILMENVQMFKSMFYSKGCKGARVQNAKDANGWKTKLSTSQQKVIFI